MLEGWDLAETLRFAGAIGASSCTALGCTPGIFTREQAAAFLAAHPLAMRVSGRASA
jgi:sugar/nucleoside kinase (ribokinase family)